MANPLKFGEIFRRWRDKSPLSLNGFGDDGRRAFRSHMGDEKLFKVIGAGNVAAGVMQTERTSVTVGIGHAIDFRSEGPETQLVGFDLAGQRHGEQRSTVKAVFKANDGRPLRRVSSDFDRVFHRLRTAVGKEGHLGKIARGQSIQPFGKRHVGFIHGHVKTGVRELLRLILQGGHHLGMGMADIHDTNAACKVDEFPAIHVDQDGPSGFFDESRRHIERSLRNVAVSSFD